MVKTAHIILMMDTTIKKIDEESANIEGKLTNIYLLEHPFLHSWSIM